MLLLSPPGTSSLRRFLQGKVLESLRQSPVLVVSSAPAENQPVLTPVTNSTKFIQFTMAQQFGLRTVSSTITSAYPSSNDIREGMDLLSRTGASSVVAVGSGAAIDLAKALAKQKELDQLILVPSTSASFLASASSHSLLLDPIEETLVPIPAAAAANVPSKDDSHLDFGSTSSARSTTRTTIVQLEPKYISSVDTSHVLYATAALVFDAYLRGANDDDDDGRLIALADKLNLVFWEQKENNDHDHVLNHNVAITLLYEAGRLLSYGMESETRSTPIALASSLIPQIFPHVHILTFFASLVPGYCRDERLQFLFDSREANPDHYNTLPPTTAPVVVQTLLTHVHNRWGERNDIPQLTVTDEAMQGFSVPDMALSHLQANQKVWSHSIDEPNNMLMQILQSSLDPCGA